MTKPMFELVEAVSQQAVIKVIGVGGGGGNAVDHMVKAKFDGVGFINTNTDAQILNRSSAPTTLQIGESLTKGLGAGANPEIGRQAATEDRDRIASAIEGADMVFIAAGMGGGTGTGAAPVIAQLARDMNMLTVAVVTKPFPFEGKKRMESALDGIAELHGHVDSLIIIPNEKVLAVMGQQATMVDAFHKADEVLFNAVQGISELITRPGLINVDFADVRTVMGEMGMAMMGSATAHGENRAMEAAQQAIASPLLEDINLQGAKGLLVNITASADMTMGEFEVIGTAIGEYAAADAHVVIGTAFDESMQDDLRVTMVATGLARPSAQANGDASDAVAAASSDEATVDTIEPPAQRVRPVVREATASAARRAPQLPKRQPMAWGNAALDVSASHIDDLDFPAFLRRQAD